MLKIKGDKKINICSPHCYKRWMHKELTKIKCSSEFVKKNYLFMYHRLELNSGTRASKSRYSYEHNKSLRKDKMT